MSMSGPVSLAVLWWISEIISCDIAWRRDAKTECQCQGQSVWLECGGDLRQSPVIQPEGEMLEQNVNVKEI